MNTKANTQHTADEIITSVKKAVKALNNGGKSLASSNEQLELINKLKNTLDFDLLDDKIKTICIYKEKYPESSMAELAEIISAETEKPITKSCINHRFRKIKEMLKEL